MRTLTPESTTDDSPTTVDAARIPRGGMRRAALNLGPSLPRSADDDATGHEGGVLALDRTVLEPGSFIPSPPFHPPRAI